MIKSISSLNFTWSLNFLLPYQKTLFRVSGDKNLAMAIFWILPKPLTIKYSWCISKLISHRQLLCLEAYETNLIFKRIEFLLLLLKFLLYLSNLRGQCMISKTLDLYALVSSEDSQVPHCKIPWQVSTQLGDILPTPAPPLGLYKSCCKCQNLLCAIHFLKFPFHGIEI